MTFDLATLVSARTNGAVHEAMVRHTLAEQIARFNERTDEHAVLWNGEAWAAAEAWSEGTARRVRALADSLHDGTRDDGWRLISRQAVFERRDDPIDLFLAAMAWGFGNRGYGWRRTSAIVEHSGEATITRCVKELQRAASADGCEGTWRAWSRGGAAKMRGLDTAFASKVAYFACFDRTSGRGPLIADINTAWALWALDGIWDSRKSAALYARYVEWAERWADDLRCRPDDIERALFILGPEIRRTWGDQRPG